MQQKMGSSEMSKEKQIKVATFLIKKYMIRLMIAVKN